MREMIAELSTEMFLSFVWDFTYVQYKYGNIIFNQEKKQNLT
jgi:hypothetical protein